MIHPFNDVEKTVQSLLEYTKEKLSIDKQKKQKYTVMSSMRS